ncbi:hypothetical protein RHGRI_006793 [Rhododendron griersonianum]|uniref:Glycoside hydrolase family 3 N-terminal domain-containing protein n=1 Tax=Rhododendron griersonianum TaxID=479676 RepID=A0AAV6KVV5_9ERIC|nr:hypothetical protein RHGRI_006793 [Rhododendron griersonianum]
MQRIPTIPMGILMVTLVICCCGLMSVAEGKTYAKYRDPERPLNARIKDLMRRMSLEEKIGQMVQIERSVASAEVMKKYFIGSVLSGGGSGPAKHASAKRWMKMVNKFQKGSMSTRLGIPMIYGIDAVHGHNNVYKATIFPHNIGLGATRQVAFHYARACDSNHYGSGSIMDPELVKKIGAATALEVRATGIHYAFAPCIAVCRDPRWGRCYESYSEDHKIVDAMTEIIPGLQGEIPVNYRKGVPFVAGKPDQFVREFKLSVENSNNQSHVVYDKLDFNTSEELVLNYHDKKAREYIGVISGIVLEKQDEVHESKGKGGLKPCPISGRTKVAACAKHYVGDGGTTEGINANNTVTSWHGLLTTHMPPYYHSIIKGVATIMVSYSSLNGEKMHADRNLVTGFLKNTLHFRGFVISDMEGIDWITSPPHANYTYSIQAGIQAGIDMVMVPFNYTEFIDGLTMMVKKRIITMSRIDDAVRRILRVKFVMGLFENPFADRSLANQLGRQVSL